MELLFNIDNNPNRLLFKEGEDIVGKITIQKEATQINLWSFEIFELYRNRGLAHKAIEEIKKYLKGNRLWLYVYKNNEPALKVYNKAGFIIKEDTYLTSNTYQMICDNP